MPQEDSEAETPGLRDQVDEELLELFDSSEKRVQAAVRRFIRDAEGDPSIEARLLDLLESSFEFSNDDSFATAWAVMILGELECERAIPFFIEGLRKHEDEVLMDASGVAILRVGSPAIEALMDRLDAFDSEDPEPSEGDPEFSRAAYELLGSVACLEDSTLSTRVAEFLQARVERERSKAPGTRALEALFAASARLGDRGQLEAMKRVFRRDYRGRNPGIQDSIEMLEENVAGLPILAPPPWLESYGWLFEDGLERSRVRRPGDRSSDEESADDGALGSGGLESGSEEDED